MNGDLILVIDEGTTSTRAVAFTLDGRIAASASRPLTQHYPANGWVEHDAEEIWRETLACCEAVTAEVGAERLIAIGITNQRETVVFWDRATGAPLAPAIVWQDRRTAEQCSALKTDGQEAAVQRTTGLLLDPYFSATKMRWGLDHIDPVRRAADAGTLAMGTVDAYLRARLAGDGAAAHTDVTNAARTLLMDLSDGDWSADMLALFAVPGAALPEIGPCAGALGETTLIGGRTLPITGVAGDQQAAMVGQACFAPGDVKATYGTGAFLLANAGRAVPTSGHRLLATPAWQVADQTVYALEGSIFVAGSAVQWLRDQLGLIGDAAETEALAASVPDAGGVRFVPALAGLGAPWWQPEARGLIAGLSGGTTKAHLVRACLEAMGDQTADVLAAMAADGVAPKTLRVDGGMVRNDWLCQDLADALGIMVERPEIVETTAMGAAMLAGVGAGSFASLADAAAAMRRVDRSFEPSTSADARASRRAGWHRAIAQVEAGL